MAGVVCLVCLASLASGLGGNPVQKPNWRERYDLAASLDTLSKERIQLQVVLLNRWPGPEDLFRLIYPLAFGFFGFLELKRNAFLHLDGELVLRRLMPSGSWLELQ